MKASRSSSAVAIAAAVVACAVSFGIASADVKSGEKALQAALTKPDNSKAVQEACDELIKAGGREGIGVILKILPKLRPEVSTDYYWQLVGGASGFQDAGALEELSKFILTNAKNALGKDLLFSLQNNSSNYVVIPLKAVLEKGTYDLQLMATDQLGNVRSVDSVDALVGALAKELKGGKDKELIRRLDLAVQNITGENLGPENWESWWKEQKPKGLPERKKGAEGASGGGTRSRDIEEVKKNADPKGVVVISSDRTMLQKKDEKLPKRSFRNYDYDQMQGVLDQLKFPHTVVAKEDFEKDPGPILKSAYAILINCSNISTQCICDTCVPGGSKENRMLHCTGCEKHVQANYKMKDAAVDALKAWVEQGGYLFTEDMGVIEVIERAWPSLVTTKRSSANGPDGKPKALQVKEATVRLSPGRGNTTHPLMRGVWSRPKSESEKAEERAKEGGGGNQTVERKESPAKLLEHKWHVDEDSPCFKVVDGKVVVTLLESEELGKIADGETAVAVTFRVGKGSTKQATGAKGGGEFVIGGGGRVLHTMSHFGKQDSSQDGQALMNLILNFLVEARKHHDAGQPQKK